MQFLALRIYYYPDFVIVKNEVPILYIEAKDIGISLDKVEQSEQMSRYYGYANLILTDYVEFRFYRNGIRYEDPVKIATYDLRNRTITILPENFGHATKSILDFAKSHKEPIKSGKHLAKIMGGKAQRIRDNIRQFLVVESEKNAEIARVYETIKKLLVHDLTTDAFADMYAQTLVYGLFVARYYDETPDNFTRQEARDLIPNLNPLLRHFFDHIVGPNFDKRLEYIVNELCEVFSYASIQDLMKEYFKDDLWGKAHSGPDPVIHFYEDFLKEYDEELRKKMGAYYTPLPVVQFIVRSVDYLLEKEFGLNNGLADVSKTADGVHKVQILDPAVGTGTFISDVIGKIYARILKSGQKGRWPAYVHGDLLPRLHGFELMMTPYTIAHLKLGMAFKKTGFTHFNRRLGIYLTNSLEDVSRQPELLAFDFAASIADEAKEASKIKNEKPIMVVLGNPPYSVSSQNKGEWIQKLIEVYKIGLNEQNINSLSDDYIKFIRFAEHFIEKNGSGIVAMITNNSFLDGIVHRQMRKHLLETFDNIYILNLSARNRAEDQNVFNIKQGVSINIFIRSRNKKVGDLGDVYYDEIVAKREEKFEILNRSDIEKIKWQKLDYSKPYYFFVPKDFSMGGEYENGFKVSDLFIDYGSGVKFRKDNILVKNNFTKEDVLNIAKDIVNEGKEYIFSKYNISETSDWKIVDIKKNFENIDESSIRKINYRIFSTNYAYYDLKNISKIIPRGDARSGLMRNFIIGNNIGLITNRLLSSDSFHHIFLTDTITDMCFISNKGKEAGYVFPLYIFTEDGLKVPNLKKEILDKIEETVGGSVPENVLDYIYAYLHSPSYREKYKEFLKIDFPRVPYPKDKKQFFDLAKIGEELRHLHLMESPKVNKLITTYPEVGDDMVEKVKYENGNVYINDKQYFGNVPDVAWNFYIGGYQPAQKWLKDRKGRKLSNEDIEHWQKIIVVLIETERLMGEVDKIKII